MDKDMKDALVLDVAGTILLVLGILGYTGAAAAALPLLGQPAVYLACVAVGLLLMGLAVPKFLRAARARAREREGGR
jgi:hypothetical protein